MEQVAAVAGRVLCPSAAVAGQVELKPAAHPLQGHGVGVALWDGQRQPEVSHHAALPVAPVDGQSLVISLSLILSLSHTPKTAYPHTHTHTH